MLTKRREKEEMNEVILDLALGVLALEPLLLQYLNKNKKSKGNDHRSQILKAELALTKATRRLTRENAITLRDGHPTANMSKALEDYDKAEKLYEELLEQFMIGE